MNIKISISLFLFASIFAQEGLTVLELMAKNAESARSKVGRSSRLAGVVTTATVLAAGAVAKDNCPQEWRPKLSQAIVSTATVSGIVAFWAYRFVKSRSNNVTRGDLRRIARGAREAQFLKDFFAGSVEENVSRLQRVDRKEVILSAWKLQELPGQLDAIIKHLNDDHLPLYLDMISKEQALEEIRDLKSLQKKSREILNHLGDRPDFIEKVLS